MILRRCRIGDIIRCKRCKEITEAIARVGNIIVMAVVEDPYGAAQVADHAVEFCQVCAHPHEIAAAQNSAATPAQEVN